MVARWWEEAEAHGVLPLDNRAFSDFVFDRPRPPEPDDGTVVHPDRPPIPEASAPDVRNRPHSVTAHITVAGDSTEAPHGVLAVQGSVLGGWSFHLMADGRLCYVHNLSGWREYRVEAPVGDRLTRGRHTLAFEFECGTGGEPNQVHLSVDGERLGSGPIKRATWARFSLTGAGLTAGWSPDFSPADGDYRGHFRFTEHLDRVVIRTGGTRHVDPEAEVQDAIARQ
jgi:arylsulfatase